MLALLSILRLSDRDDFGSLMFLLVAGIVALIFVGYLITDFIKTLMANSERKRRHREEHHHR